MIELIIGLSGFVLVLIASLCISIKKVVVANAEIKQLESALDTINCAYVAINEQIEKELEEVDSNAESIIDRNYYD